MAMPLWRGESRTADELNRPAECSGAVISNITQGCAPAPFLRSLGNIGIDFWPRFSLCCLLLGELPFNIIPLKTAIRTPPARRHLLRPRNAPRPLKIPGACRLRGAESLMRRPVWLRSYEAWLSLIKWGELNIVLQMLDKWKIKGGASVLLQIYFVLLWRRALLFLHPITPFCTQAQQQQQQQQQQQ